MSKTICCARAIHACLYVVMLGLMLSGCTEGASESGESVSHSASQPPDSGQEITADVEAAVSSRQGGSIREDGSGREASNVAGSSGGQAVSPGVSNGASFATSGGVTESAALHASSTPTIEVKGFVLVGSQRSARTRMTYTVQLKLHNTSPTHYANVVVTLAGVPSYITPIDDTVLVGDVSGNATLTTTETLRFDADLTQMTGFSDFVWQVTADTVTPPPVPGEPDVAGIFMNIDNGAIQGGSVSKSHRNWIKLSGYHEGMSFSADRADKKGLFVLDGVTVSKRIDSATPQLHEAVADGAYFGEIQIDIVASCGDQLYTRYAITLNTAVFKRVSVSAAAGDATASEELVIEYGRIDNMFTPVTASCELLPPVFSSQDGRL